MFCALLIVALPSAVASLSMRAPSPLPQSILQAPRLPAAYGGCGYASGAVWTSCAVASLATYKPHRILHNAMGVAQASVVLPLIYAVSATLVGAERRGEPESRRLTLAWAAASAWSAVCVRCSERLTRAVVRGAAHPVTYPPLLAASAVLVHAWVAVECFRGWRRAASTEPLAPAARLSTVAASEAAVAAAAFAAFALGALVAPFPLATLPSTLGKRMARAFGPWALLWAAACAELRGADAASALPLRRGLGLAAAAHLGLAAVRPFADGLHLYPAAMQVRRAWLASLLPFLLVADAARRRPVPVPLPVE